MTFPPKPRAIVSLELISQEKFSPCSPPADILASSVSVVVVSWLTPFERLDEFSTVIDPPPPTDPETLTPTETSSEKPNDPLTSVPSDQFQLVPSLVEKPTPLVSFRPIVWEFPADTVCVFSQDSFQL